MLKFFRYQKYLDSKTLAGFKEYKYACVDTNPMGVYIMHPFWNYVVRFVPTWVAPNLLTLVGFLFIVSAFLVISFCDYSYLASCTDFPEYPPIKPFIFILVALCIFISYTLDGIDGKQARRTKTSGPVGELFDHGLDSWTTVFIPAMLYSVFGRTGDHTVEPVRYFFICWSVFLSFYSSHWEKYNTGVLYLPWSYDFSMVGTTLVFFVTGFRDHTMWKIDIFGFPLGKILEVVFYISTIVLNLPRVFVNIFTVHVKKESKQKNMYEGMRPLIPFLTYSFLSFYWILSSPNDILKIDPRLILITMGTIFSNICVRLIIAQMSNTRCQIFNWMIVYQAVVTFLSTFLVGKPHVEYSLAILFFIGVLIAHVHYGACVVLQMCRSFKIRPFTI